MYHTNVLINFDIFIQITILTILSDILIVVAVSQANKIFKIFFIL